MLKTVTSDDTLTIYNRVFNDLADGDVTVFTFPDNLVELKTGKNQNTIYAKNEMGNNADLVLRVMRGSGDDIFLQTILSQMIADLASTPLAAGTFVKRLGDGQGNITNDTYTLQGGVITNPVEGKENVAGDTDQAVAIYKFKFALVTRSIQ